MLDVTVPPLFPERAIPGGVLDGVLRDRTVTTQTILSCNQAKSFPDALHSATFQLASCVDGRTTDFMWNIAFFFTKTRFTDNTFPRLQKVLVFVLLLSL